MREVLRTIGFEHNPDFIAEHCLVSGIQVATRAEAIRLGYAQPDATILPTEPREPTEAEVERLRAGPDTTFRVRLGIGHISHGLYNLRNPDTSPSYTYKGRGIEMSVSPADQLTSEYDHTNIDPNTAKARKPGLHIDNVGSHALTNIYNIGDYWTNIGERYHLLSPTISRDVIGGRSAAERAAYVRAETRPDDINLVWIRLDSPKSIFGGLMCNAVFDSPIGFALHGGSTLGQQNTCAIYEFSNYRPLATRT